MEALEALVYRTLQPRIALNLNFIKAIYLIFILFVYLCLFKLLQDSVQIVFLTFELLKE